MSTPAFEFPREGGNFVVSSLADLTNQTFEGIERLTNLNLQTVKTTLAEQESIAQEAVSSNSLEWVVTLPSALAQANYAKALAYWRHVGNITIETATNSVGSRLENLTEWAQWTASLFVNVASRTPEGAAMVPASANAALSNVADAAEAGAKAVDK
jgi:phasin family protein